MENAEQLRSSTRLREPLSDLVVGRLKPLQHDIAGQLPRLRDLSARLLQRHGEEYHAIARRTLLLLEHLRHDLERRYVDESLELFPLVD